MTQDARNQDLFTIDEYVRVAQIYDGGSREEILAAAESLRAQTGWRRLEDNLYYHTHNNLSVPRGLVREVLQLGRKISNLEAEALYLRQRAEKEEVNTISISVKP